MRQVRWYNKDAFSIFFNMKVYCVFSLESPHRGDSNEYTQYTISQYKKRKLSLICNYGICSKGPKNEFEPAVVNEPSVFEPLKFYCMVKTLKYLLFRNQWTDGLETLYVASGAQILQKLYK